MRLDLIGLVLSTCLATLGCQANPIETGQQAGQTKADGYTSVCRIRADKNSYIGKMVRMHVHYKTDNRHYSQVLDKLCAERNIISVGNIDVYSTSDQSVINFFREGDALCTEKGTLVCPMTADVDVEAKVVEDDGELFVEFQRVFAFKYLDN